MTLIDSYIILEKLMIEFDQSGDITHADLLRDAMDPIWYSLSDEDHEFLANRHVLIFETK